MNMRTKKSFTLTETIIAAVLIAVITVAFFSSLITAFSHLRRLMELRTASLILQEEVSKVRELKFSDIQSLGGTFSSSSMSLLKNAGGVIMKSNYVGSDKIIKITFKLDWTAFNGEPKSKTLVTLMTDHGINKQ